MSRNCHEQRCHEQCVEWARVRCEAVAAARSQDGNGARCNTLHHAAALRGDAVSTADGTATHCITLQHAATSDGTATHCNAVQHAVTSNGCCPYLEGPASCARTWKGLLPPSYLPSMPSLQKVVCRQSECRICRLSECNMCRNQNVILNM